jgi:uncharacterized membrane protein
MDWLEFGLALALFVVSHRLPAFLGIKGRLVAALGRRAYGIGYSLLSLALFAWLIAAAGRAPFVPLWDQQGWMRWLVNLAMPLVFLLGSLAVAAPNPFAFEGRKTGFDPARPGVAGLTRQPLLWAMALWAAVHLIANGDLAHVVLFGAMLALTLSGMALVEARARRQIGADWPRFAAQTALLPFAALVSGRWRPRLSPPWGRLVLALGLWALAYHLHEPLIGLWPGP